MSALGNVKLKEPKSTPQTEKAAKGQKRNNDGGFSFKIDDKDRFRRFLTIGSDGGTYYVGEQKLTEEHVKFVQKIIKRDGLTAVEEIVNVSSNALAPKNTQALFALAVAFTSEDLKVKAAAKAALPKVARTSTHLFEFAQFIENIAGWGRAKTSAVASWYEDKTPDSLAYQAVKYRQRNGWTHRDLFRLSHPQKVDSGLAEWILRGNNENVPEIISIFEELQAATTEAKALKIMKRNADANIAWEFLPTELHNSAKIWSELFYRGMGHTALLRNTSRMHKLGLFNDMKFAADYAAALADENLIRKGRMHPIQYLNAYAAYNGDPDRQAGYWGGECHTGVGGANNKIVAALEAGYNSAFQNVEPANKRTLMGLDVSGSMSQAASGLKLSCATLGAAFSQTLVKREPYAVIKGFSHEFKDLGISDSDSLKTVMSKVTGQNFGRTDCSLPMVWALEKKVEVDTFVVFTDNETYAGRQHPHQALERYRQQMGIPSRLVVVAATATRFSIADPSDAGSLDVSGFDASTLKTISDFSAGRI